MKQKTIYAIRDLILLVAAIYFFYKQDYFAGIVSLLMIK